MSEVIDYDPNMKHEDRKNIYAQFFKSGDDVFCRVGHRGQDNTTVVHKLNKHPYLAQRFSQEYREFMDEAPVAQTGTPLEELPGMTSERAIALRFNKVPNVETLAELDDAPLMSLGMGALALRKSAQNLLAAKELETLKQNSMTAGNQPQPAEQPRRRGRPPKDAA